MSVPSLTPHEYLPVAYLPGASGRSSVWEPIANVLAHRREALLFNYPGLEAPGRDDIDSLADLTRWVASELPERCDVVSLSMGSAVALRLALEFPECVRRLCWSYPVVGSTRCASARSTGASASSPRAHKRRVGS